ncbi:MAG: GntR family transcriptional regulator [Casimicrobiaceae bacterium]
MSSAPSFRPLYFQIRDVLEKSLEAGEWGPGDAIPSEMELAARFRVAHGTVRKAIEALAADNLVVRRQGKGTFVATHTEETGSMFRFLRIRRDDGVDEYPASRLLEVRRAKAGAEIARLLAMRPADPVLLLRRVLDYGGEPVVLDDITLPAALFRGLTRARLLSHHGSIYGLFEREFGVHMCKAEERLRAVVADAVTGPLLAVPAGAPLLAVDRVTFTYGDRPVEVRRGLYSTRRHHYVNVLN